MIRTVARLLTLVVFVTSAHAQTPTSPRRPTSRHKSVGGPVVGFVESGVRALGVYPPTQVYFASVSLFTDRHTLAVEKPAGFVEADRNGVAEFRPSTGVRARSVWIVVDAATGGFTVASPPGFLLREVDFPGDGLQHGAQGALHRVAIERSHLDLFLVRPGTGMWNGNTKDGSDRDTDGEFNGRAAIDLGAFLPVGSSPLAPDRFLPGDIVFVVDRNHLEFFVTRIGQ